MFVAKLPVTEKIQFYRLNFNGGVQILKLYEMEYLLDDTELDTEALQQKTLN